MYGVRSRLLGALLAFSPLAAAVAHAQPAGIEALQQNMRQIMSNPVLHASAVRAGQERALLCTVCHGKDGISTRDWIPNLAGQNPAFLLEQMHAYAHKLRIDMNMNKLIESMSPEELINVALFYASQPLQARTNLERSEQPGDAARGKRVYDAMCLRCHGPDGRDEKGYAWLAGQKSTYLRQSLERYRNADDGRIDPDMRQIVGGLSDEEIANLVKFLGTL